MRLLVGLGNPGPEYADTRHNVGFKVLERIAGERGLLFRSSRHLPVSSLAALADPDSDHVGDPAQNAKPLKGFHWVQLTEPAALLVQPRTYMNLSGEPLGALCRRLALYSRATPGSDSSGSAAEFDPGRMLVVYDDMDLDPGVLRLRPKGGHGGHNGMRSIIDVFGTNAFPRLRIGIGRASTDAARHVLEPFADSERPVIETALGEAAEAALDWLASGDIEGCMTRFHSRWSQGS